MSEIAQDSAPFAAPAGLPAPARRGLFVWLGVLVTGGIALVATGQGDGALLLALAGQFVAARVTDRDASWWLFNVVAQVSVPLLGAAGFGALAWLAWQSDAPRAAALLASLWCVGAAILSVLLYVRPVAQAAAALLFRTIAPGHTLRLAARLVVLGLLLPVPALVLSGRLLEALTNLGEEIADPARLLAGLAGEIVLALAGVGWLIDRGGRETARRLGLGGLGPRELGVAAVGLLAILAATAGLDRVQHTVFPGLWQFDRDVVGAIAGHLSVGTALLLGLSAGVGEEIAVRGALQPRLGIVMSSLLFACLHVQYSWFGMLTVGVIGVLLGLIRARSNTTTAMLVHAAFDVIAALQH